MCAPNSDMIKKWRSNCGETMPLWEVLPITSPSQSFFGKRMCPLAIKEKPFFLEYKFKHINRSYQKWPIHVLEGRMREIETPTSVWWTRTEPQVSNYVRVCVCVCLCTSLGTILTFSLVSSFLIFKMRHYHGTYHVRSLRRLYQIMHLAHIRKYPISGVSFCCYSFTLSLCVSLFGVYNVPFTSFLDNLQKYRWSYFTSCWCGKTIATLAI